MNKIIAEFVASFGTRANFTFTTLVVMIVIIIGVSIFCYKRGNVAAMLGSWLIGTLLWAVVVNISDSLPVILREVYTGQLLLTLSGA